jgi:autotransporter strand-loop-strand O-heptosyltransferase
MREKYPQYFIGKKVLDIGSLDINGNNRFLFHACDYIGLDVGEGANVDVISVGHLYDAPNEYFDTIISTEVFEHDMFYEKTINNIIRMLKPGGAFIFTCASTGRDEHGTRKSDGSYAAPLLQAVSEEWSDYYKNLDESDILAIDGFRQIFPDGIFEYNGSSGDLYFFGVKDGIENSQRYTRRVHVENVNYNMGKFNDDIFVLGAWPSTFEKESDLLDCISRLRNFPGIPILLVSHYPIKPEIQKLVDYYIFDKDNDILTNDEFERHGVSSGRWTKMGDHKITNEMPYHHDYAIWISMRHAFNFCKYLGKSRVHYLEYDNLIDPFQYQQAFLDKALEHDAVLYEYSQNSTTNVNFSPYCATYIFSARTDILVKVMSEVNSKMDYFVDRPNGWQLERIFLHYLKKHTSDYIISPYIANNHELNTQAVWNRDGVFREGLAFQVYPCVDDEGQLYLHLISGFHEYPQEEDILLEIRYSEVEPFFVTLGVGDYKTIPIGQYRRGSTPRVFAFGKEVFSQFLGESVWEFRKINKLSWDNKVERDMAAEQKPNEIVFNFVDGPFVEIRGNTPETYTVRFIDKDENYIAYETRLKNNQWGRSNRKWFTNWKLEVESYSGDRFEYHFDATGKRVFIVFESSSLGDTLAWIPYVEEFRKKHNCEVIVSTFLNNLLRDQYPELEFVEPGSTVHDLYALYRIGCFYNEDGVDGVKHKSNFLNLRLQEYATDILGLDFKETLPRMPKLEPMKSQKPYICIANHSTAQSKYWNNPTGWQELVDYVKSLGYDVYLLSREEDGYMGNKNPEGVIKVSNKSLQEIGSIMLGAKCFVGISSGLSWLAWSLGVETILISGQTDKLLEPEQNIHRIINESVCHACFSRHLFDRGDWNWCPDHTGTERQFECSKEIPFSMVQSKIDEILGV